MAGACRVSDGDICGPEQKLLLKGLRPRQHETDTVDTDTDTVDTDDTDNTDDIDDTDDTDDTDTEQTPRASSWPLWKPSSPSKRSSGWMESVDQYKTSVKQKYFQCKDQHFLSELYTEPVIIQKRANGVFKNVRVGELFKSTASLQKTVVILGNSGSGKSVISQKILLDWASEEHYHDFDLVFYLRCEELKCISEEMSLMELLSWSCSLTSDQISEMLQDGMNRMLFIIDGLDEFRLTQDIYLITPSERASQEVIICSLVRRCIIPKSILLITAGNKDSVDNLLKHQQDFNEIVGFSKRKVEEYFQKFFQDEELFRNAYESVKANETLFTACSIPVICWIICTVIRERFNDGADVTSGLETTTSIYVDFVFTLLEHHCQGLSESVPTLLKSLGQLAERGMLGKQVLFDEKSVNEIVSGPAESPFLGKFLFKKRTRQETMFSFMHLSFQEFFTALYFVLLDEEESRKKVRELLHTVQRGLALSCWSVSDLSKSHSKQLQPVILFLCGLCKNELIDSFFEKHNVAVPVNTETLLKEWIHEFSLRYQHENKLFLLHCLYELHDKSFTGEVLEGLILIDLSDISLNRADCWVLQFCLQCCKRIRNLQISVTSDHLKILQAALCSCEGLCIKTENSEIHAEARDEDVTLFVSSSKSRRKSKLLLSGLSLTCSCSEISKNILPRLQALPSFGGSTEDIPQERETVLNVLQSVSSLKKVCLQFDFLTDKWVSTILSLTQTCPSLTELRINATYINISLAVKESLRNSLTQTGWTLTVRRKFMLMERDTKRHEKELKTENKEESLDSVACASSGAELSSTAPSSVDDAKVFTPEYIDRDTDECTETNTHRFMSPHAGQFQCSLTSLVFVMEGKGEILYKIVPWNPSLLDGLGQMEPAGPLYNIKGSISELHLPHCEILSEENEDRLAVAHFTGDNVEILQPLRVTDTHVIIGVTELSLFGLLTKRKKSPASPVRSQVLLFLQPSREQEQTLYVHMLPANVPVSEVQSQHKETAYIKTTSACDLIPDSKYSLCCQPERFYVQPQNEKFVCNFGPNFHPTFEVFMDVDTKEFKMGVLGVSEKKEVWATRRIILTAQSPNTDTADTRMITEFVDGHRDALIARLTSVMAIADSLRGKNMIPPEEYTEIENARTRQTKTRLLFDVLDSGGSAVKAEFYRLLRDKEPYLVEDLQSGPLQ